MQQILRPKAVFKIRGRGRSSHYTDVKAGLYVPPVAIGPRAKGYPESEVAALNAARIAGRSEDEIRHLVAKLVAARQSADSE